jgi:FkbM family methyltransferase
MHIFKKILNQFKPQVIPDNIKKYIIPYLPSGSVIQMIDIGAHQGKFTDDLLNHYTVKEAILIEPIPRLANLLKNKYPTNKYHIYQNVVSDNDEIAIDFFINEFAETSSLLKIRSEMKELENVATQLVSRVKVVARTLDAIVAESGFRYIDLIKLDVQGAEHLVIKGATNTLTKTKLLWTELSFKPLYEDSSIFHQIYELLVENNFVLLELSPGYRASNRELLQVDALFVNSKL